MSAFYAVAYEDRVELLTDGAIYADDGTLLDIRRKVWTSDRLPLAITGRGNSGMVEAMATAMLFAASVGTFDEAAERIDGMLRRRAEKGAPADFEMVLVGISETRGPVIYYAASCDAHGHGIEPWQLHDAGREFGGGNPVDVSGLDGTDGLLTIGVELFERMRAVPGGNPTRPDLPDLYGIGGHIDWTVVAANGAETMRIWEWPDVIGEPIDPAREGRSRDGWRRLRAASPTSVHGTGWLMARCSCMKPKRSFFAYFLGRMLMGFATLLLGGVLGLAIMTQMLLSERKPSISLPDTQQEGHLK